MGKVIAEGVSGRQVAVYLSGWRVWWEKPVQTLFLRLPLPSHAHRYLPLWLQQAGFLPLVRQPSRPQLKG